MKTFLSFLFAVLLALPAAGQVSPGTGGGSGGGGGGGGTGDFTIAAYNASFGTAGTPDSQVQSVQGITNGTAINIGNATGAFDTDSGAVTAQTLRTKFSTEDVALLNAIDENGNSLLTALSPPAHAGDAITVAPELVPLACEAADIDGSALPNVQTETTYNREKCSLSGVKLNTEVNEAGTISVSDLWSNMIILHGVADTGGSIKFGYASTDHGYNTPVDSGDRVLPNATREGLPFFISGSQATKTIDFRVADADGAQSNVAIATCGSGCKVIATRVSMKCDNGTTNPTDVVVGFGSASTPTPSAAGNASIVADFVGIPPGGGQVEGNGGGILGIGADGEDLRFTMEDPVGGTCTLTASYYTSAS